MKKFRVIYNSKMLIQMHESRSDTVTAGEAEIKAGSFPETEDHILSQPCALYRNFGILLLHNFHLDI